MTARAFADITPDSRQLARMMLSLDERMTRLGQLALQLRALPDADGILAAIYCDKVVRRLRGRWWDCAERLVGKSASDMTAPDIRALARRTETERRAAEL